MLYLWTDGEANSAFISLKFKQQDVCPFQVENNTILVQLAFDPARSDSDHKIFVWSDQILFDHSRIRFGSCILIKKCQNEHDLGFYASGLGSDSDHKKFSYDPIRSDYGQKLLPANVY
jgi:hypothetical protein